MFISKGILKQSRRGFRVWKASLSTSTSDLKEKIEQLRPKGPTGFGGGQVSPAQSIRGLQKFYKEAVHSWSEERKAWQVLLDGKTVKTPQRNVLETDSEALAFTVALEWEAQKKYLEPALMPMTGIVCALTDQYPQVIPSVIEELKRYLVTDTICFRASKTSERELYYEQKEYCDPIIGWMEAEFSISLGISENCTRPVHADDAVQKLESALSSLTSEEICALYQITAVCKSLSIGLALVKRRICIEEALKMARLEEEYNIRLWGLVEGGHDVDRAHIRVQLAAASTLLWLKDE